MKVLSIKKQIVGNVHIDLPKSKSIANRLLIAQALSSSGFSIGELPDAEDTKTLLAALVNRGEEINIGIAGTAMRFLTAYYAIQEGRATLLTGDLRMKERPISVLVEQLKNLGANIAYSENEGYPPITIQGMKLLGEECEIDASVSSQYITALLLIAPYLEKGLKITLSHKVVSFPYIDMTLNLQKKLGIKTLREGRSISVSKGDYEYIGKIEIEKDWSAAAFFYQFVALGKRSILLKGVTKDSIQGDAVVAELFSDLGVKTSFTTEGALLESTPLREKDYLEYNLIETPDLAQAIAVTASVLVCKTKITGISTLRIKETDRVVALQQELAKVGSLIEDIDEDTIIVNARDKIIERATFNCYNDHRMAMSLTPLITCMTSITIDEPEVVKKSFPTFWNEIEKLGVQIS